MLGDAASCDSGSCDFGFCGFGSDFWLMVGDVASGDVFSGVVASVAGVVAGAATVWCVETPGSMGPFSDRAARPLLSARGLIIPDRPAQSTAITPTATTD